MNYKQKVRLEIVGIPYEYTKLNRLNKLSDAKCRPYYVIESVRKISTYFYITFHLITFILLNIPP